jgi:hypothetical protein
MTVYQGVLEKISGGRTISSEGAGGYYTHNVGIERYHKTGVDTHAGWTQRQFVDIGGIRIKNVMLTPLHDELLQEAVGEKVALSMTGPRPSSGNRHTVLAVRTPKAGIDRTSRSTLMTATFVWVLRYWVVAVVVGILLAIAGQIVLKTTVVGLAFAVIWAIRPFVLSRRMFAAAGALGG